MDSFRFKHLHIDFLSQQIYAENKLIKLDPKAFYTLKLLIKQSEKVVSNDELINEVWDGRPVSTEVIVAAIARIRKMFKEANISEEAIRTVHKVGYKFVLIETSEEDVNVTGTAFNRYKAATFALMAIVMLGVVYIANLKQHEAVFVAKEDKTFEAIPIIEGRSGNKSHKAISKESEKLTHIYFLRHAEKAYDGSDDPHLSKEGFAHAEYWRKFFKHINFDRIYTTKFHRNVETAEIVANGANDKIKIYSALTFDIVQHLPKFKGEIVLIVGHSNTIPGMVNRVVGRNQYEPMSLDDYASFFQITIDSNSLVTSQHFNMEWPSK